MSIISVTSSLLVDGNKAASITIEMDEPTFETASEFFMQLFGDIMRHANASKLAMNMAYGMDARSAFPEGFPGGAFEMPGGKMTGSDEPDMFDPDHG